LSKRTVNSYITTLRRFARWVEQVHGEFDAAAITPLDVADYRRQLVEKIKIGARLNLTGLLPVLLFRAIRYPGARSAGKTSVGPVTLAKPPPRGGKPCTNLCKAKEGL